MDVPAPARRHGPQLRVTIGDRVSEGSVLLTLEPRRGGARPSEVPRVRPTAPAEAPAAAVAGARRRRPPPPGGERARRPGGRARLRARRLHAPPSAPPTSGLKTVLIERYETLGGVCLNVGCIPSKALLHAARVIAEAEEMAAHGVTFGKPKIDLDALLAWKQSVVDKLTGGLRGLAKQRKVEVVHGVGAASTGPHTRRGRRPDGHVRATASSPPARAPRCSRRFPTIPRIFDSTGALSPRTIPKRLLVIGGGIIGLEMATVYDALGSRVTVVELLDQLIPGCDPDLVAAAAEADLRAATRRSISAPRSSAVKAAEERAEGRVLERRRRDVRPDPGRRRAQARTAPRSMRPPPGRGRRRGLHPRRRAAAHQRPVDLRDRRHRRRPDARPQGRPRGQGRRRGDRRRPRRRVRCADDPVGRLHRSRRSPGWA